MSTANIPEKQKNFSNDEAKHYNNVDKIAEEISHSPSLLDDPTQYEITNWTEQISECVMNTDGGGILEAIQKLSSFPKIQIENPLTPLVNLIRALASHNAIMLDRRTKLEIAKQLRSFIHLTYLRNKQQLVTEELVTELLQNLKNASEILNGKDHIEDEWTLFELETAKVGIQLLRTAGDKDKTKDFIYNLIGMACDVVNLINPIQAAVSAAKGVVGAIKLLVDQREDLEIDPSAWLGVIGFLKKEAQNIANKKWYEKIVILDVHKHCAVNNLEQLIWLQENIIRNDKDGGCWQLDYATVLALKEIIQKTRNVNIARQAWAGNNKTKGLVYFQNSSYPEVQAITARSYQEISIVHKEELTNADLLKSIGEEYTRWSKQNVTDKTDQRVKKVLVTPFACLEMEEAFKKEFHKRKSKEERAIEQLRVMLDGISTGQCSIMDAQTKTQERLDILKQSDKSDFSKTAEALCKTFEEWSNKGQKSQDDLKGLIRELTESQKRIQAMLLFHQKGQTGEKKEATSDSLHVFLNYVAFGQQGEAEAMVENNKDLVFGVGTLTDSSKRTFKGITAFQYAVWALDWRMWNMLLRFLGQKAAQKQIEGFKNCAWVEDYGEHVTWQKLLDSIQAYIDHYDEWDSVRRRAYWHDPIGKEQLYLPIHVLQEYNNPAQSFDPCPDFSKQCKLQRKLPDWLNNAIAHHELEYGLARGKIGEGAWMKYAVRDGLAEQRGGGHAQADLSALAKLYEARIQQRKRLVEELQKEH
jgi:hypothetical protein